MDQSPLLGPADLGADALGLLLGHPAGVSPPVHLQPLTILGQVPDEFAGLPVPFADAQSG